MSITPGVSATKRGREGVDRSFKDEIKTFSPLALQTGPPIMKLPQFLNPLTSSTEKVQQIVQGTIHLKTKEDSQSL